MKKLYKVLLVSSILIIPVITKAVPVSWEGNFTTQLLVPLNSLISSKVGIGTSTPGGLFSIHAPSNLRLGTSSPLLLIASSTASATTTFFNMSNVGSTTHWGILNIGSNSSTTGQLASSTFNNGIRLASGCFQLPDGTCAGTGGITSLNGLTGATQTFTNDTNVTMVSGGTAHVITWSGTLADSRVADDITLTNITQITNRAFTNITGGSAGSIIFSDGTNLAQNNANLFWDNTAFRFGLGTTTPGSLLSVQNGNAQITGTSTTHALVATSTLFIGAQGNLLNVMQGGFIGMGTTSPGSTLSIQGVANFASTSISTIYGTTTIGNLIATSTFILPFTSNQGANTTQARSISISTTTGKIIIATSTAGQAGAATTTIRTSPIRLFAFRVASTSVPFGADFVTGRTLGMPSEVDAFKIEFVKCYVFGGTSITINFTHDNGATDTNAVVCTTTSTSTKLSIGVNNSWTSSQGISMESGAVSGSPSELYVSVFGSWSME